jgi:hypothetical protein
MTSNPLHYVYSSTKYTPRLLMRPKPLLSNYISQEKFIFLKDRLIHEAICAAQEGINTIKTK